MISGGQTSKARVRLTIYSLATPEPESPAGFSVSNPAASEVRQSSEVPQRHRTGVEGEPETDGWAARFMANRWGIGSVNVTL